MARVENWDVALCRAIAAQTTRPHDWGRNNCVLRFADLVEAVTGVDHAAELRPLFAEDTTREDALRVMAANGWESVADIVDAFLPRIEPREAKRGDGLLMPGPEGPYLAMKVGRYAVGPAGADNHGIGVVYRPASMALAAWRVG